MNYLNGNQYQNTGNAVAIPILERRQVPTRITGQLVLESSPLPIVFRFQRLQLVKGEKVLLETTTDANGRFSFLGVAPNGSYAIQLVSEKYRTESAVDVKTYEINDLTVVARSSN